MSPSLYPQMFREYPAEQWCFNWWHKVRYGSNRKETQWKECFIVEYFCKKCEKKTDGFTHIKIGTFDFTSKD